MIIAGEWNYHSSVPLVPAFYEDAKTVNGHGLLSVPIADLAIGDLLDVDAFQQLTNMTSQWAGVWVDAWLSATPATAGVIPAGMSICSQGGANFDANGGTVHHLVFGSHFKWTSTKAYSSAYVTLRVWANTDPAQMWHKITVDQPGYGEIDVTKRRYALS